VQILAGMVYSPTYDIIGQFIDAIDLAVKMYAVYLVILSSAAIVGLWISKTKGKYEYVQGFKLSLFLCVTLFAFYLVLLWNIYWI
jgi:hypothetical protein